MNLQTLRVSFFGLSTLILSGCLQPSPGVRAPTVETPAPGVDPAKLHLPVACIVQSVDGERFGVAYPEAGRPTKFESPRRDFKFDLNRIGDETDVKVSWRTDTARAFDSDAIHYRFSYLMTLDYRQAPIPVKSWALHCDHADLLPDHID